MGPPIDKRAVGEQDGKVGVWLELSATYQGDGLQLGSRKMQFLPVERNGEWYVYNKQDLPYGFKGLLQATDINLSVNLSGHEDTRYARHTRAVGRTRSTPHAARRATSRARIVPADSG